MEILAQGLMIVATGFVIRGLWRAGRRSRGFVVRVVDQKPCAVSGTVSSAFLLRVSEVVAAHHVSRGSVSGEVEGERIRLRFSRHFPEAARQQLRNWWVVSGWKPARNRACR